MIQFTCDYIHAVRLRYALTLLCLFLCVVCVFALPTMASAAVKARTPSLSATLPAGWNWNAEGSLTAFYAPAGLHSLAFFSTHYEDAEPMALLAQYAPDTPIHDLGNGRGYIYQSYEGAHVWAMLTRQGLFCEVTAKNSFGGMAALLRSLSANNAQMQSVVEGLRTPAVTAWLTFAITEVPSPTFSLFSQLSRKESVPPQPFEKYGLKAMLPQAWRVTHSQGVTTFASPDHSQQASAQFFTLPVASAEVFISFARAYAKKIGARNIRTEGNIVECTLPGGITGIFSRHGGRCLLVLTEGDSVALHVLAQSIEPQ